MAETATFAVVLEDQTSGAAASAAAGLSAMRGAVDSAASRVQGLQKAMRNLKGPGVQSSETYKALAKQLTAAKAEVQSTTEAFVKAGGSFETASKGAASMSSKLAQLNGTFGAMAGPYGRHLQAVQAVKGAFGGAAAAAVGFGLVLAIVAIGAVKATMEIIKMGASIVKFALEASTAAMQQQTMWEALTGSASAAVDVSRSVAAIAGEVPLAASEVAKLATELAKSGKRGKELENALYGAAMKSAGFENIVRGSESARRAMLPLSVQVSKLQEDFARIFAVAQTEGFLRGVQSLLSMFKEGTSTSLALKKIVSTLLDPLFSAATKVGPYVKMMFKGMVIGALLMTIAVVKVGKAIKEAVGDTSMFKGIDGMRTAMYAGIAAAFVLVAGFAVLAAAAGILTIALAAVAAVIIGSMVIAAFLMALPFILFAVVVGVVVAALYGLYSAVTAAVKWMLDLGAAGLSAAKDLITGLVNGIKSGAGAVYDALKAMASKMGATIKSALGIASPSKLFAGFGKNTALGMAVGVEDETPAVDSAIQSMVAPPAIPEMASAGAQMGQGGGGGPVTITIPLTLNGMSKGEETQARSFVEQLCETFEDGLESVGIPATVLVT
jgi:hypothetical protein